MTFVFDENIGPNVVAALKALGKPAVHVLDYLPRGTPDELVLDFLGKHGWFLVTQDVKITKKPHQRRALVEASVGGFFLTGRANRSPEEMTVLLLQVWDELMRAASGTKRPFIYGISDKRKFERLD